jgi:DNA-binding MarR family transcriptional regulator
MNNTHIASVLVAIRRVIRATDLHSRNLIKITGLTAPQQLVLMTIKEHESIIVGDLAQRMSLSQATVSTILDRLEDRGLVTREKAPQDKRRVNLKLTERGTEVVKDAPLPLQNRFVERFSALPEWEQSQITAALQRIAHMMDADSIDAAPVLDLGALDRTVQA